MILGSILNPINSSIIAVALVPIAAAFGAPASRTAWLVSALYLATSIGQPLVGRLVDVFGPRRLFLIGASLALIAGIVGTFAPSIGVLIAARVILGFGTCAGYPASMYLIRSEGERTGVQSPAGVLTALSIATQTIAVIGPTLGGVLIGVGGWRATFAVNIPLGIACLVLGYLVLPKHASSGADPSSGLRLDLVGILLFATTLVSLLLFLMNLHASMAWLLGITIVAGAGFALRELRVDDPFIDVRVFAGNVPLLVTYARAVVAAVVSYSFLYGFTQWLEDGRGLSASSAGLVLLPTFAVGIIVATLTGPRPQVRGKLIVGAAAQLVACSLLLFTSADTAVWLLVVVTLAFGVPQGLVNLALQNTVYYQADPARIGASSGLLRTFMYLGAMLASSASGALFGERATTGGMHDLAWFMVVSAGILLVVTVTDRTLKNVTRRE
ncbi:MFS transporter [Spelaeicoccus albus]